MNELFLYDRDNGLFKEILNQSKTIEGRYHISPNYGHDLNANNLDSFLKDPAYGLTDVKQKYPICICMTPFSRFINLNGQKWEEFYFNIYFLCTAQQDGTNKIKKLDRATNTSGQHTWYDWSDMKQCASDFLEVLKQVSLKKNIGNTPLKTVLNIDFERAQIGRLTKFNNDKLNGVSLSFIATMATDNCVLRDYESGFIDNIIIPNE